MVGQHADVLCALDPVARELCWRGHEVVFLDGSRRDENDRAIAGVTKGHGPEPVEEWPRRLRIGRQVINRGIYWRKSHPSPERVSATLENRLPDDVRAKLHTPLWRTAIGRRAALHVWRWIEAESPASPTVISLLQQRDPDVMLVSPATWSEDPVEADYLHAGRVLGIPTIGCVNQWDDLTSHGTVHVVPDMYLVWNEPMAQEAVDIHDIPASTIRITGAPHLDEFFALRPRMSRAEVCASMGRPDAPYIVFLGTPRTIWHDDSFLVNALGEALAREFGSSAPAIVLRPHECDTQSLSQEYCDQLAHATCVFGLNTPALLDAVVANRPCVTIVNDMYWPAQGRTGHFRHLLKGEFLDVCRDAKGVAACVRRILNGADPGAAGRREFTRWFLRPCGLDVAASEVAASVVETAARPNVHRAPLSAAARRHSVPGLSLASQGIGR